MKTPTTDHILDRIRTACGLRSKYRSGTSDMWVGKEDECRLEHLLRAIGSEHREGSGIELGAKHTYLFYHDEYGDGISAQYDLAKSLRDNLDGSEELRRVVGELLNLTA